MKTSLTYRLTALVLCCCLLVFPPKAKADSLENAVIGTVVAIVLVTAAITVGVVYAVRHDPSVRGCASSGPDGLTVEDEASHEVYVLSGDVAAVKVGDRIKVSGKRKRKGAGPRSFIVTHFRKDYGPCKVTP